MEEKFKDLYNIIGKREGAEQSEEIIDSLKYMFDEKRYDKVIPFVDYQQKIISFYMNQFNVIKNYNNRLIFYFLVSAGINTYFLYKLI
jgi:hypothetical protein